MTQPQAAWRRRLGAHGEQLAAEWYEAHGYQVMARNWRCVLGELDLVCRRGGTLVICEVKTRSSQRFGTPAEAVNPAKRRRLRRLSGRWLAEHPVGCLEIRFDVASVSGSRVEVLEEAF